MDNPPERFSDRVDDYVRFRPSYPREVIELLGNEFGLGPETTVADVGSGTGIFASLLLDTGCRVLAVEPNALMRAAAVGELGSHPRFVSVNGSSESTGLEASSLDGVTAAQAFHWFRVDESVREFRRILRPDGWIALVWNQRPPSGTPFLDAYERFLERWGTDYQAVRKAYDVDDALPRVYGPGRAQRASFFHAQVFDYEGLEGRLLSSSYTPARHDPQRGPMLTALRDLFSEHADEGTVRMEYETTVYYGRRRG